MNITIERVFIIKFWNYDDITRVSFVVGQKPSAASSLRAKDFILANDMVSWMKRWKCRMCLEFEDYLHGYQIQTLRQIRMRKKEIIYNDESDFNVVARFNKSKKAKDVGNKEDDIVIDLKLSQVIKRDGIEDLSQILKNLKNIS